MSALPKLLCLVGPTGSGKTAAALHLAAALESAGRPVTVINADSRQVYCDFPIITAQPSPEEKAVCPHKLYGWLESTQKMSAGQWAALAEAAIQEALAEGRLPMLVGGTGFYLRALLDGIAAIPDPDPEVSRRLTVECEEHGAPAMHARLAAIDPDYAAKIHPNDSQRCVRAMEVWESTGRTFTWWHGQTPPPAPYDVMRVGIGLPLAELTPYLERRIRIMIDMGALDEAQRALKICPDIDAPAWTGIGCAETAAFLRGRIDLPECVDFWAHNTRAYAKRQWTWFRADKRILWHRPGEHRDIEREVKAFLDGEAPSVP